MTRLTVLRRSAFGATLAAIVVTILAGGSLWTIAGNVGMQALGGWLTAPMKAITFLGDERFYLVIIPLLFWCVNKELGAELGVLLTLSGVLNGVLKSFLKHHRPFWENERLELSDATSFSLPSGHAQNSAALLGQLALNTTSKRAALRIAWRVLLIALMVLVPVSRVYLGVHFVGDVIWGVAAGLLLLAAYEWLKPVVRPWLAAQSLGRHVVLAVVAAALVLAINFAMLSIRFGTGVAYGAAYNSLYPDAILSTLEDAATMAGMVFGLWAGLAFESRFVRFSVVGPWWQRAVRFVIGIAGLLIIWMGLKVIFPAEPLALGLALRTLRYALSVLWAIVAWPWIFVRVGLAKSEAPAAPPVSPAV